MLGPGWPILKPTSFQAVDALSGSSIRIAVVQSRVCRARSLTAQSEMVGATRGTNAVGSQPTFTIRTQSNGAPLDKHPVVHVAKNIPAERRRVFFALTVPEYMESWLAIPSAPPSRVVVRAQKHGFSISCLEGETPHSIRCCYRACDSNKLIFDWKHDAILSTRPSLVTIRLIGEFERTNLELTHSKLDQASARWHREFWEVSLTRLSRLF